MPDYTVHRTFRKKLGRPCRLFGKDFISVSQAARHYALPYKQTWFMVEREQHRDSDFAMYRKAAA